MKDNLGRPLQVGDICARSSYDKAMTLCRILELKNTKTPYNAIIEEVVIRTSGCTKTGITYPHRLMKLPDSYEEYMEREDQ